MSIKYLGNKKNRRVFVREFLKMDVRATFVHLWPVPYHNDTDNPFLGAKAPLGIASVRK